MFTGIPHLGKTQEKVSQFIIAIKDPWLKQPVLWIYQKIHKSWFLVGKKQLKNEKKQMLENLYTKNDVKERQTSINGDQTRSFPLKNSLESCV